MGFRVESLGFGDKFSGFGVEGTYALVLGVVWIRIHNLLRPSNIQLSNSARKRESERARERERERKREKTLNIQQYAFSNIQHHAPFILQHHEPPNSQLPASPHPPLLPGGHIRPERVLVDLVGRASQHRCDQAGGIERVLASPLGYHFDSEQEVGQESGVLEGGVFRWMDANPASRRVPVSRIQQSL